MEVNNNYSRPVPGSRKPPERVERALKAIRDGVKDSSPPPLTANAIRATPVNVDAIHAAVDVIEEWIELIMPMLEPGAGEWKVTEPSSDEDEEDTVLCGWCFHKFPCITEETYVETETGEKIRRTTYRCDCAECDRHTARYPTRFAAVKAWNRQNEVASTQDNYGDEDEPATQDDEEPNGNGAVHMTPTERIQLVTKLNGQFLEANGGSGTIPFEYHAGGIFEYITFAGEGIWDDDENDVPWNNETNAPAMSLEKYLLQEAGKIVESFQNFMRVSPPSTFAWTKVTFQYGTKDNRHYTAYLKGIVTIRSGGGVIPSRIVALFPEKAWGATCNVDIARQDNAINLSGLERIHNATAAMPTDYIRYESRS